jgi:outer membrane protein assembly factor BamD
MPNSIRRGLALLLAALGLVGLLACASAKKEVKPADELWGQAEQAWQKQKWDQAADFYGQIRDYYPYHTKATLAQFRAAEALYRQEKYIEALAAFETFQELHPNHAERAQVLLRIGQCHFRLSPTIDRDQAETESALKAFQRVKSSAPNSHQAVEVGKLITQAYTKLIHHELYVARYYFKTKAYRSAIGRYQKALTYPEIGFGPRIKAELALAEARVSGQPDPPGKLPPEPPENKGAWWKIWE